MLAAVARLRLSPRRLLPAARSSPSASSCSTRIGRVYIAAIETRPAYQLVAGAVGLLVYLYLLNQLILFGAAYAATAPRGARSIWARRRDDQPAEPRNLGEPHGQGLPSRDDEARSAARPPERTERYARGSPRNP